MGKDTSRAQIHQFLHHFFSLCYSYITAIRIVSEFWWTNKEFFPVDIILPWFSMFIYHFGDEQ
jgi:hypothetical protein